MPDYRELLAQEFDRLSQERGPTFQFRSFAQMLGLSQPFLSQLLSFKAHLSLVKASSVCDALEWPKPKKKYFMDLVEASAPRFKARREASLKRLEPKHAIYTRLNETLLNTLTWRHFALLELIAINQPNGRTADFEGRVGLKGVDLESALEGLSRAGLAVQRNGTWVCTNVNQEIVAETSIGSMQTYHSDVLREAMQSFTRTEAAERQFETFIMSFAKADLPQARAAIIKFQTEFHNTFRRHAPDAVYCLSTQLFRMDNE